jgi:tape measure domain-containing protein
MAGSRAIEAAKAFVRIFAQNDTEKTVKEVERDLDQMNQRINTAATVGLAGIAAGAIGVLSVASSAEQTAVAFEVMLGSASQAKMMLDQIYQLGKESPFQAVDFQTAGATLLQFGVSASEIVPTIAMLGDVAAGDAEKLSRLAVVFGQVSAAGRLTGGDVLQMINSGFNPLKQIAQATGESMIELRKRMEAGGISSQEVAAAFRDARTISQNHSSGCGSGGRLRPRLESPQRGSLDLRHAAGYRHSIDRAEGLGNACRRSGCGHGGYRRHQRGNKGDSRGRRGGPASSRHHGAGISSGRTGSHRPQ